MALSIADYLLQLPEKYRNYQERVHSTIVCFPTTEAAHFS